MKHHNRYEAKKYAPRVTPEQRVKAFVLVGCVGSAPAWGWLGGAWGRLGGRGAGLEPAGSSCSMAGGAQGDPRADETPQEQVADVGGHPEPLPLQPVGAAWGAYPCWGWCLQEVGGRGLGLLPPPAPTSPPAPPPCCRDLDQAADAAIEHKNETEMNFVLSKCTASTDAAVAEKLNRARAQLLKK